MAPASEDLVRQDPRDAEFPSSPPKRHHDRARARVADPPPSLRTPARAQDAAMRTKKPTRDALQASLYLKPTPRTAGAATMRTKPRSGATETLAGRTM